MQNKLDIRYIEEIGGHCGPAWIARVTTSRSGRTVYFNGRSIKRGGRGASGNHFDLETGQTYWISGVKKRGSNRHWAGGGIIFIEQSALAYVLKLKGIRELDPKFYKVIPDLPLTDPAAFVETENQIPEPAVPGRLRLRPDFYEPTKLISPKGWTAFK